MLWPNKYCKEFLINTLDRGIMCYTPWCNVMCEPWPQVKILQTKPFVFTTEFILHFLCDINWNLFHFIGMVGGASSECHELWPSQPELSICLKCTKCALFHFSICSCVTLLSFPFRNLGARILWTIWSDSTQIEA